MTRLARILGDRRGATAVEFALVALPLLATLMGALELGYASYVRAVAQGALEHVVRDASIGDKDEAELRADVVAQLSALVPGDDLVTTIRSFRDFSRYGKPEKLVDDKNKNGQYDKGDCFEDANGNKTFDKAAGAGTAGLGNPDEVVAYTINVDYPTPFPVAGLLGWSGREHLQATTMLRYQPFGKAVQPAVVCA